MDGFVIFCAAASRRLDPFEILTLRWTSNAGVKLDRYNIQIGE